MKNPEVYKLLQLETKNLVGFLTMLTGDRHIADDLFQETCLEALRLAHKFTPGSNFRAWVQSIARFQILRYRRKHYRERLIFYSGELMEQLQQTWEQQPLLEKNDAQEQALQTCLQQLEELPRQVLDWRYRSGISCEQIGQKIERSAEAIKMMLCRLRKKLRSCVQHKISEQERVKL